MDNIDDTQMWHQQQLEQEEFQELETLEEKLEYLIGEKNG